MEVAKIIREDFLQQNAFTDYDFTCPLVKSIGMLRTIITFYNNCQRIIADSPAEHKVRRLTDPIALHLLLSLYTSPQFATTINNTINNDNTGNTSLSQQQQQQHQR
jgi:V-type H+-transporting ATPase subunit A